MGDLVMRVKRDPITRSSRSGSVTINIEIDGIHNKEERKKRFCTLRDQHLKFQGVIIFRIEASSLQKMEDKDLEKWLRERVDIVD
jgi:very-short-patch-repair endonuclease